MDPHFPPGLEVTTQHTLGALSALLAQRGLAIAAVPATSIIAAYLVKERRFPHRLVEYSAGAPAEHILLLLTPAEVPTLLSHSATADGVVLDGIHHDGFSLAHAAALFANLAALRTLPVITSVTSRNMTCLYAASFAGHLDVVSFLVGVKGELIDVANQYGQTCLFAASSNGHLAVSTYLAERSWETQQNI